jgi:hypothetical protein
MPETVLDLAGEVRDRGFAARAGDGGDGRRLARMHAGSGQRQHPARIGDAGKGYAGRKFIRARTCSHDCDGTARHGIGDEARPIGAGTRISHEDMPGRHGAAVHGQAGDGAALILEQARKDRTQGQHGRHGRLPRQEGRHRGNAGTPGRERGGLERYALDKGAARWPPASPQP